MVAFRFQSDDLRQVYKNNFSFRFNAYPRRSSCSERLRWQRSTDRLRRIDSLEKNRRAIRGFAEWFRLVLAVVCSSGLSQWSSIPTRWFHVFHPFPEDAMRSISGTIRSCENSPCLTLLDPIHTLLARCMRSHPALQSQGKQRRIPVGGRLPDGQPVRRVRHLTNHPRRAWPSPQSSA